MIERSGERVSGISLLAARHDDDDDDGLYLVPRLTEIPVHLVHECVCEIFMCENAFISIHGRLAHSAG